MNYGSMKTVFFQTMKRLQVPEVSLHDFAEAIDSAQVFIASNIPQDVAKGLMVVAAADVQDGNPKAINKPPDMMKIESARVAGTRTLSVPDYVDAVVVGQREYLSKAVYSSEKLVCEFNDYIAINPAPASAVEDYPGSVELVYRRRPVGFMRSSDVTRNGGKLFALNQDADNRNLFDTSLASNTLDELLYVDYGKMIGGTVIAAISSTQIMKVEVLQVWNDAATPFTWVLTTGNTHAFTGPVLDAYVFERYTGIATGDDFAADEDTPDLSEEFHSPMLDIAIGKFLMPFKAQEASQYIAYAGQALKAYGITMKTEFGGIEQ